MNRAVIAPKSWSYYRRDTVSFKRMGKRIEKKRLGDLRQDLVRYRKRRDVADHEKDHVVPCK